MFLFVSIALAAPFRLVTPPGIVPEVLPSVSPDRIDVMVRGVTHDPRDLWPSPSADGVRISRAVDLGGVWAITIWPTQPVSNLSFTDDGKGGWVANLDTTPLPPRPAPAPISLAQVLSPSGPALTCDAVRAAPLLPLHGQDMFVDVPAEAFAPAMPRWSVAEPRETSWARVSAVRMDLFVHKAPVDPAIALYELGALHRDLGHAREAAYYFGEADKAGVPDGIAALQRAGALLSVKEWDKAGEAARHAAEEGATEDAVVAVLGTSQLTLGNADGVLLGRALASRAVTGQASLVAGALLLRANCSSEAEAPLARAAAQHDASGALAQLLLVDTAILHGDVAGAEKGLTAVDVTGVGKPWSRQVRERTRLLGLLRGTPDTWLAGVPGLSRASKSDGPEGLDALYVLGQIGAQLGDEQMAVDAWVAMLNKRRSLLTGDPGQRLVNAWSARTSRLLREGKDLDALAFHAAVWRPGMLDLVQDPSALAGLAESAIHNGLYESGLRTLVTLSDLEARRGLDDRQTVLELAELYLQTNRFGEALDTLDFLATRPKDRDVVGRATVLRGRVLDAKGDAEGARKAWATVKASPAINAEARLRIAALDASANRCEAPAVAALRDASIPSPDDLPTPARALLAAHCLQRTGAPTDASAALAGVTVNDPTSAAYAAWLGGASKPGAAPWQQLATEDAAWGALAKRISAGAAR